MMFSSGIKFIGSLVLLFNLCFGAPASDPVERNKNNFVQVGESSNSTRNANLSSITLPKVRLELLKVEIKSHSQVQSPTQRENQNRSKLLWLNRARKLHFRPDLNDDLTNFQSIYDDQVQPGVEEINEAHFVNIPDNSYQESQPSNLEYNKNKSDTKEQEDQHTDTNNNKNVHSSKFPNTNSNENSDFKFNKTSGQSEQCQKSKRKQNIITEKVYPVESVHVKEDEFISSGSLNPSINMSNASDELNLGQKLKLEDLNNVKLNTKTTTESVETFDMFPTTEILVSSSFVVPSFELIKFLSTDKSTKSIDEKSTEEEETSLNLTFDSHVQNPNPLNSATQEDEKFVEPEKAEDNDSSPSSTTNFNLMKLDQIQGYFDPIYSTTENSSPALIVKNDKNNGIFHIIKSALADFAMHREVIKFIIFTMFTFLTTLLPLMMQSGSDTYSTKKNHLEGNIPQGLESFDTFSSQESSSNDRLDILNDEHVNKKTNVNVYPNFQIHHKEQINKHPFLPFPNFGHRIPIIRARPPFGYGLPSFFHYK